MPRPFSLIALVVTALSPTIAIASEAAPALAHIAASGAQITAQDNEHGLQTYVARSPDHFMVFDLSPDGQAIVSGVLLQITLRELEASSADRITELPRQHSLRAFFLRTGQRFQVFYATPDEQRVIPGTMWDASGHNVTRDQIAAIPGTRPTVDLETVQQASGVSAADSDPMKIVSATTSGFIGSDHAPTAWVFVDPQCSFSIRAMQQLTPAIAAGKLRLAVVPLSILDREDNGLSTQHALAMVTRPPAQMVADWEAGALSGEASADAVQKLKTNISAAQALQLRGTPTFFWQRKDGSLGRQDGVPASPEALLASMGGPA